MNEHTSPTIDELARQTQASDYVMLDVRPIAAYNGWRLGGEPRGGHIKGAKSFPLEWMRYDSWPELLEKKGISRDQRIVVYGYTMAESDAMRVALTDIGYRHVRAFDRFHDWSANDNLPMQRLQRYQHLVYPEWVHALATGKTPPTYDNDCYVICHASYRYREDYESGHIPGAIHMDTEKLECSKDWNRRSPDELRRALQDMGIRHDTTVVLYGRFAHPNNKDEYPGRLAGHLAAMRCAQILLYAGVTDVRILNGGMKAWRAAGYDTVRQESEVHPVDDFGVEIPQRPELIIDTPEAKRLLSADDGELVSIRSWEEFIGNVSGYNYIENTGRIPGAVFGNCGSDAYHMEN